MQQDQQQTYQIPQDPATYPATSSQPAYGVYQQPTQGATTPVQQPTYTPYQAAAPSAAPQPTNTPPQQPTGQQPATPTTPAKKGAISAQNTLLFSEMRENMIIMSDGSFRAVVECQSINFDLMSSREREGIEFSYQNFLNSLYFPIQVLIRSQRVDIGPYLDRLAEIRRNQDNMLLNVLMDDYMNFIDILSQEANIMDKRFFIVVPYYPVGDLNAMAKQAKGLFDSFFSGKKEAVVTKIDQPTYEKAKDELKNRVDTVMNGLFQMGVKSRQLNTKQLSELFYLSYNPDTAVRQPLGMHPEELTSTYVRKGQGESPYGGVA
ncbi:MAG: hypothetical protein Q4A34_02645 [Candidatus Saccharibacteria bacterium]|nr:hypothetical protein [Candidatus Saccharibacteria bacterium]